MTTLGIVDAYVQDTTAWCQVQAFDGPVRVGDLVRLVRRADGATASVSLTVEAIELPGGQAIQLDPSGMGRLRLTGVGVEAIQPGGQLITTVPRIPPALPPDGRLGVAPYGPSPSPWGRNLLAEGAAPDIAVVAAERLSRPSTAFRSILVIPQAFVLYFLGIARNVVAIIGWFGALFTGRLPEWAGEFIADMLCWQTRVTGYAMLVTDEYPPFSFKDHGYPVQVMLPERGRLNRLSVLFRLLLAIPATVLSTLVVTGWAVASFVVWLVVLIAGRYPTPLFGATVAILRYSVRVNAYVLLLTSRYPTGLFGDKSTEATPSVVEEPAPPYPDASGYPQADPSGAAIPPPPASPFAPTAPVAQPGPFPLQPALAETGRLSLTAGAKRLLVTFLALGVLAFAGYVALIVVAVNTTDPRQSARELNSAYAGFSNSAAEFQSTVADCPSSPDQLSCLTEADSDLADALDQFSADVRAIDRPSGTDDEFESLLAASADLEDGFRRLAQSSSIVEYQGTAAALQSQQQGHAFDAAYAELMSQLSGMS